MTQAIEYDDFKDYDDYGDQVLGCLCVDCRGSSITDHDLPHPFDCLCSGCDKRRAEHEEQLAWERDEMKPLEEIEERLALHAAQFERRNYGIERRDLLNGYFVRENRGMWGRTTSYRNFGRKPRAKDLRTSDKEMRERLDRQHLAEENADELSAFVLKGEVIKENLAAWDEHVKQSSKDELYEERYHNWWLDESDPNWLPYHLELEDRYGMLSYYKQPESEYDYIYDLWDEDDDDFFYERQGYYNY